MEKLLKAELNTIKLQPVGRGGGGCISSGQAYATDSGEIFVKMNQQDGALKMFEGEYASLSAIQHTNTVACPKPIKVVKDGSGACLVTDYLDIKGLRKYAAQLGEDLARMHLHNEHQLLAADKASSRIHTSDDALGPTSDFGFHIPTCCGFIPQDNTPCADWVTFFIRQRLQYQLDLVQKEYRDNEAHTLWGTLMPLVPSYFKDLTIRPALLHGDMWSGNVGEIDDRPVIFDPASFYGHHEYEFGIATMFGGLPSKFFDSYHKIIPRAKGFDDRVKLYQLFHYLNHWNHFGSGYRGQSISLMKQLIKNAS